MPSLFKIPIEKLKGVGPKSGELFRKLGIDTVGAMIRFYPRTYEDWSNPYSISEAPTDTPACVKAAVEEVSRPVRIRGGMVLLKAQVTDGEDRMSLTFFNQAYLYDKLREGGEMLFYGTVKKLGNYYEMASPVIADPLAAGIHPIYPKTAGLSAKKLENAAKSALDMLPQKINDPLPEEIRCRYDLCDLGEALHNVHFPDSFEALERARTRLAFEELLILQLGIANMRGGRKKTTPTHIEHDVSDEFICRLPFTLTGAQKRAIGECVTDMLSSPYPMNRLVQGDVGSGKTAVAAAVCYTAAKNGLQCTFMAPTEILARQHYESLSALLQSAGLRCELLTGSTKAAQRREICSGLENGDIDIIIGTHALISDEINFCRLGLVVTDEQHRFGVAQRSALITKGSDPHILVMSATPIPRTLALMIFGDLDLSILDELPPGRQKTATYLIDSSKRIRALGFIKKHIQEGHQAYIVCPLVGQSEMSELQSAEEYEQMLQGSLLSDARIGLLHGKMKPRDKEKVMAQFSAGELDVLVSTTVVEVGVDVPNATVMLIENAERFGLSQLHQLRGRVGRGKEKAFCIMITDNQSNTTQERLRVMCKTNDGFRIADEDLRLRGPGDFFGSRQHGLPELKAAGMSDMEQLENTREAAHSILLCDPTLSFPEHRGLAFETDRLFSRAGGHLN